MAMTLTPGVSSAQQVQLPARTTSRIVVDSNPERGGPEAVVFDGTNLWVVHQFSNEVVKVAGLQRPIAAAQIAVVERGRAVTVGRRPVAAAFDGTNIWVANFYDGTVTKLQASDGMPLGTFDVGDGAAGVKFDGTGVLVVANGESSVTKLRGQDGAILE